MMYRDSDQIEHAVFLIPRIPNFYRSFYTLKKFMKNTMACKNTQRFCPCYLKLNSFRFCSMLNV